MMRDVRELLNFRNEPKLHEATMLLSFSGWMDGGDVSTGTVERLRHLLSASPIAETEPDPFYVYNFPGSMEIASLFRPHIKIENGLVETVDMPSNTFYCHEPENLVLFIGREPNLHWRTFRDCIFEVAERTNVQRILFVGSFGGAVPHTREPRLYVACSRPELLPKMEPYGVRRTGYEGPGSFVTYLMTQTERAGLEMASLVAEIPGYLQGPNLASIEAITRRLAKILKLPLDLDDLRSARTDWELQVSGAIDENEEMAAKVREMEEDYDNELLEAGGEAF